MSQVAGIGLLDTINITNANVTLQGVAGVAALSAYNIGNNGTLKLASTVGIAVGSSFTFTGDNSRLVLGNGVDVSLLGAIQGFGAGRTIDFSALATSASYADKPGTNNGGVLTLFNAAGNPTGTLALASGEFTTANFLLTPNGSTTLITVGTAVTGVTASPSTALLGAQGTVTLTLTTTASVTVAGGPPTLTLNDGGSAIFDAAASSSTSLVFTHVVQPGQSTADLAVTGVTLNGATIKDAGGNALNLAGAVVNPAGTLQIDAVRPTVSAVTIVPGTADLGTGAGVLVQIGTSEAVTVTGSPTLTLSNGGTALYDAAASTATSLAFRYTVAAGQDTADLGVATLNLAGAAILDAAGNALDPANANAANPAGTLQIDTVVPTIVAVTTNPASGSIGTGNVVSLTLATSEAVIVTGGPPTLTLSNGATAFYNVAASTPDALVFSYTVASGDTAADLAVTALNLAGGAIADAAGNALNLAGAVANPAGTLSIDTIAPVLLGITASPATATLGTGAGASFTLSFDTPVTVAGSSPTLTLNNGGTALYDATASTATSLVFRYTVLAGQDTADLAVTGLVTGGATIADAAGNAIPGIAANPAGTLQIDTVRPTVVAVTTNPASGSVGSGSVVSLTLATSEAVVVTGGPPTLALSNGATALYNAAASTPAALVFSYTVAAGQDAADLAVTALNLAGGSIADPAGNALNLAGAVVNPAGTLQIDAGLPTVSAVTMVPGTADLGTGAGVLVQIGTSEAVTVTGSPTLTLSNGGTAFYDATASTATSLAFRYTVAAGQDTADLGVATLNLAGAAILDAAGNALDPANANAANPAGTLQIDTVVPTVVAVTTNPASGSIGAGRIVAITLTPSEQVTVAGGPPTLTLNNGGVATYNPTASTSTSLVFTYTVSTAESATPDLAVIGTNLNGATIIDPAGNPIDLSGAIGNPAGTLAVDPLLTPGSVHPFALVVSNPDPSAIVTVNATVRPTGTGIFSDLGSGTLSTDGRTYTVTGTAAQVTAALNAVTYTTGPGEAEPTGSVADVSDAGGTSTLQENKTGGSDLIAASTGDVIIGGAGSDTLRAGAEETRLVGGGGSDIMLGAVTGASTLTGGAGGGSVFFGQGGVTRIEGGSSRDTVSAGSSDVVVITLAGGSSLVGLGSGRGLVNSQGADTIVGGSGAATIGAATGSLVGLGTGDALVSAASGATVVGGSGSDTVGVRGDGILFYAGSGPTIFIGGTGNSTVVGGTGNGAILQAGSGGGLFAGGSGGNNVIVSGAKSTTIFGGGNGDVLHAVGAADIVIQAGPGNETISGSSASGNNTFFAGSGNTLIGLGSGTNAVFAGTGNSTMVAGTGTDIFAFANGRAGGSNSIVGFKMGTDRLSLQGYADGELGRALAGRTNDAGAPDRAASTTLTLSDNTRISFLGMADVSGTIFGS